MRDASMKRADASGEKYAVALKKYGRAINFDDLDTTVCCSIILYDSYYKFGNKAVPFTNYEIGLTRQLHALRNKMSHDESSEDLSDESERKTLRLLYGAVSDLDLVENEPDLARDILSAYSNFFAGADLSLDQKTFLDDSERFERAEDLYKWEAEKALPLYKGLADNGFLAAQKRLLEIYTHTVRFFDLNEAAKIADRFKTICSEGEREKIHYLNMLMPHAIWGTPEVVDLFLRELKAGSLVQNGELEQYLTWIRSVFPYGMLSLLEEGDAFAAEAAKKVPNLQSLSRIPESDLCREKAFKRFLVQCASDKSFKRANAERALTNIALTPGGRTLARHFAALDNTFGGKSATEWSSIAGLGQAAPTPKSSQDSGFNNGNEEMPINNIANAGRDDVSAYKAETEALRRQLRLMKYLAIAEGVALAALSIAAIVH